MSVGSIHTNTSALVALSGLNKINTELDKVTKKVNTGYKVADASDDGAAFAVAQGLRGDLKAIDAVTTQLSNAKGLIAVASSAGVQISDTLGDMQKVLVNLASDGLTTDARTQYQSQYDALKAQVDGYISNASFSGQNILNTTTAVKVISNVAGDQLTVTSFNLSTDVATKLGSAPTTQAAAVALLSGNFATAKTNIGTSLSSFGAANTRIDNQISYLSAVSDATTGGLGNIVDADLAKESAKLQALQTQQQLASQTLQIANQSSSFLLSLFRN